MAEGTEGQEAESSLLLGPRDQRVWDPMLESPYKALLTRAQGSLGMGGSTPQEAMLFYPGSCPLGSVFPGHTPWASGFPFGSAWNSRFNVCHPPP